MLQSVERYGQGCELQLEDLALATACARGIESAWEDFHRAYRQYLVNIAGDCDLADQVIAELYQGQIAHFRGRSSRKGWLRAIVHQAQVDRHRRESRLTALDGLPVEPAREEHPEDFERRENAASLSRALCAEVDELAPDERLLLAWYYADQMRLAEIARLRGVHESTISRELDSIRKLLRKRVTRRLREEGFSGARIDECFRHSTDAPVDLEKVFERARNTG
ncbi:MAG: sigma-70 family RNA polymerase sigma factor [Acidobacteria bacterium]|nr:sigma-70 family RNA polymerase sigma factor [Acidobacteriota bacterium]